MAERKLRTTYREDMALFPSRVSKFWIIALLVGLVVAPFVIRQLPSNDFWLRLWISCFISSTRIQRDLLWGSSQ